MSAPLASLLVVEDDPAIASRLVRGLRQAGFAVELRTDGEQALASALNGVFDMVLLDLMLPGRDGLELLQLWRGRLSVPVLVLTARTDLDARLSSFELGAVDWMAKPFFMEELLMRVRTRLRISTRERRTVAWADAVADMDARRLDVAGVDAGLTAHQFNLLAFLLDRPRRVVARQQLAEGALTLESSTAARTVDSHIARIRKALGPQAAKAIRTVRGFGYCFDPAQDD